MASERERSDSDPAAAVQQEIDELLNAREADYVASLEAEITNLKALIAQKNAVIASASERADKEIAAAAKRLSTASSKELEQRTRKLLETFLPFVDDLDRAIEAATSHTKSRDVRSGLELMRRNVLNRLAQLGVSRAPALGEKFDPKRHEAVAMVPVKDAAQVGHVVGVTREGYLIGEDTLRPAGVAVGAAIP